MRGFTIVEFLITIAISVLLVATAVPIYGNLQVSAQLNENSAQIIQTIRIARMRSLVRYNDSSHGVKFTSNSYTLYQGSSYATRQPAYDRVASIDNSLDISWSLSGSSDEVSFLKSLGTPSATGTITLIHDVNGNRVININNLGRVEEN